MINLQTGGLTIAEAVQINPGASLGWILNLNLGKVGAIRDMNNGWKWLDIANVQVEEEYFSLSFAFYAHSLRSISLVVSAKKFDLHADWDTWSEKTEMDRLDYLQKWLEREVGGQTSFTWGSVGAFYDLKGGSSSIVLRYT